jgi:hypothetical protein
MTQDEIMQLAKDAGLRIDVRGKYFFVGFVELSDLLDAAITKEREALAQPEQEPVKIAHRHEWFRTGEMKVGQMRCISCGTWGHEEMPQRTWVGLTDDEIDSCFEDHGWSPSEDYYPVIKAIEAKLKEKNGYAEENT